MQDGAEGVLVAQGSSSGGYALYLKDGKLHYAYNFLGVQQFHVATDATVDDGKHELRFEFEPTGEPDLAHGKGTPGARPALRRRQAGRRGEPADHHPARHRNHRRALVRARRGVSDHHATTPGRSRSPASLEKVVVDVSGELIEDKARRCAP